MVDVLVCNWQEEWAKQRKTESHSMLFSGQLTCKMIFLGWWLLITVWSHSWVVFLAYINKHCKVWYGWTRVSVSINPILTRENIGCLLCWQTFVKLGFPEMVIPLSGYIVMDQNHCSLKMPGTELILSLLAERWSKCFEGVAQQVRSALLQLIAPNSILTSWLTHIKCALPHDPAEHRNWYW